MTKKEYNVRELSISEGRLIGASPYRVPEFNDIPNTDYVLGVLESALESKVGEKTDQSGS